MVPPGPAPTRPGALSTGSSRAATGWSAQYCFVQEPPADGSPPLYRLVMRQQPSCARICSFRDKIDRRPIDPPPIVQILTQDGRDVELHANSNLFLVAHLVDVVSHHEIRTDSGTKCTAGTIIQSPHCLRDLTGEPAVFFAFPDLSIRAEGLHRLEFRLYTTSMKGTVLNTTVLSEPFRVLPPKLFPGMASSTLLTRHIAEQGFKLRVRKKNRSTKMKGRITDDGESEEIEEDEVRKSSNEFVTRGPLSTRNWRDDSVSASGIMVGMGGKMQSHSPASGHTTRRHSFTRSAFAYPAQPERPGPKSESPSVILDLVAPPCIKVADNSIPRRVGSLPCCITSRNANSQHPHHLSLPIIFPNHSRAGGSGAGIGSGATASYTASPSTISTTSSAASLGILSSMSTVGTSTSSNPFIASSYFDPRLKRRGLGQPGMPGLTQTLTPSPSIAMSTTMPSSACCCPGSSAGVALPRPSSPPMTPPPIPPIGSSAAVSDISSHLPHHHQLFLPPCRTHEEPQPPSQPMETPVRLPSPASLVAGKDLMPGTTHKLHPQRSSEIPDVWDRRAP